MLLVNKDNASTKQLGGELLVVLKGTNEVKSLWRFRDKLYGPSEHVDVRVGLSPHRCRAKKLTGATIE